MSTPVAASTVSPPFTNLAAMIAASARCPAPAMRFYQSGHWRQLSYADLYARASDTARGLIALGVRPGDRVAILGTTTPEWTLADLGALLAGAVVVPVYHTNSPEEVGYVLEHSRSRVVFCEDAEQVAKVRDTGRDLTQLEHVILMRSDASSEGATIRLDDLRARAREVSLEDFEAVERGIGSEDPATVVYTSGTTGPPKGCILTHGNLLATMTMYEDQVQMPPGEQPVVMLFLPLAHVLARLVQFIAVRVGAELAYWRGDNATLLDDLREIQPTHLPTVPRVFEKLHTVARSRAEDGDPISRAVFSWAIGRGARMRALERAGRQPNLVDRAQYELADRLVLSKVRDLFGRRITKLLTGAAPLGVEVLEFFDACGLLIQEGYGLTESCSVATLNVPEAIRFGTVGRARPGVEIQIAGDGEILLRGPMVSPGYLDNEAATREAYADDGWLRTGDLGRVDAEGYLSITGRKKDLIITSSGKNIAPANIETELQETRWISHAVVYGDNHPYLVAVVTIDPAEAPALAEHAGLTDAEPAELPRSERVRELLRESIDEVNGHFARIEQIKRFDILERDLTLEDSELTPTMKVRRALVYDRYRDRFEALYEEDEQRDLLPR
jgi:long-chain acyl-CoA synthetase